MSVDIQIERRALLGIGSAAVVAFAATPGLAFEPNPKLPDVGSKFYPDGRVRGFAGNTIICHVPQQGRDAGFFRSLLDIYRELPTHDFASKITLLPPSSYHMTLFGCANDQQRKAGRWPAYVPSDASIEECSRLIGERLRNWSSNLAMPIRMRIALDVSPVDERPLKIRLVPYDDAENARVRAVRGQLSEIVGIRAGDHDSYEFHVTLAYLYRILNRREYADFRSARAAWHKRLADRHSEIHFGPIEFCTFADMFDYQQEFLIK